MWDCKIQKNLISCVSFLLHVLCSPISTYYCKIVCIVNLVTLHKHVYGIMQLCTHVKLCFYKGCKRILYLIIIKIQKYLDYLLPLQLFQLPYCFQANSQTTNLQLFQLFHQLIQLNTLHWIVPLHLGIQYMCLHWYVLREPFFYKFDV